MKKLSARNIGGIVLMAVLTAVAENLIFKDEAFPYEIVCQTQWVEDVKNDTLLQLRREGKKTRFKLRKYTLDSTDWDEPMLWARYQFAVDKEMAEDTFGVVLFSDTGMDMSFGDLRAFELCALYIQTLGGDTVWWGQVSRWTATRKYGYYAEIITDTTDLLENIDLYEAMLDSVRIVFTTFAHRVGPPAGKPAVIANSTEYHVNDLLGRKIPLQNRCGSALLVGRKLKRILLGERPVQ